MCKPFDFVCLSEQIGTDEFNAPIYSEEYIRITEKGLAYLSYLDDKEFDRHISVKIALAALVMSTVNTVILVIRFYHEVK